MNTPSKELTPQERAARYAELRAKMGQSRIAVTPPAGIAVRWVRKDDANDISLHEWMGFTIAKDDPKVPREERRFKTSVPVREDGTYMVGDVILMEIDAETYEFFIQERLRATNAIPAAVQEEFQSTAAAADVPTFKRTKSGKVLERG